MTMREFGEKYQGNIQAALRGYQRERLVAAGADADFGEIDKSMRKRKWVEGIEAEMEKNSSKDGGNPRAAKTRVCQVFSSPPHLTSLVQLGRQPPHLHQRKLPDPQKRLQVLSASGWFQQQTNFL
jgi:hypothetical protein